MRNILLFAFFSVLFTGCYIDVDGDEFDWGNGVTLINENFRVTNFSGNQMYASSSYRLGKNEYIVVYQDFVGSSYDIYGVVISGHDGTPVSSHFKICDAVGDQTKPFVVYNSTNDEYLVVWEDYRSGVDYDIYGAIINADTLIVSTPFAISSLVNRDEREPKAAYDDIHNRYLVVWDEENAVGELNIYGRILNGTGGTIQDVNICSLSGNQQSPYVVFNPNLAEYFVVWMDTYYGESDVYGRFVGWDGSLIGSSFAICDEPDNQDFPVVAYNSAQGEYLVVWEDDRNGDSGIWGQLLDESGAPIGKSYTILDDAYNQRNPHIVYNERYKEYLVVWEDNYYGNIDIFGYRLDRYGARVGYATLLSDKDVYNLRPNVSANTNAGEYLIVWHARITSDYDIVGQLAR